jgi:hypothetical protein
MVKYGVYITLGKHCGSSTKTIHNIGIVQGVSRDVYPMIMGQKTLAWGLMGTINGILKKVVIVHLPKKPSPKLPKNLRVKKKSSY